MKALGQGVVELRQYTLHPGRRDALIELFERHFVRGQEDVGIHVLGQFRELDDPDLFVWLRGFDDLDARTRSLEAFYYGPVWKAYREPANATMIDSDNVLMMRPLQLRTDTSLSAGSSAGVFEIVVQPVASAAELDDRIMRFTAQTLPDLEETGATVVAAFASLVAPNGFPALPVRDDLVLCWVSRFTDRAALESSRAARASLVGPGSQTLTLTPTAGSRLR